MKKSEDERIGEKNFIFQLEAKINDLKKQNLQLMDSIQPCPLPDSKLVEEVETKNKELTTLQRMYHDDMTSANDIIIQLSEEVEKLNDKIINLEEKNYHLQNERSEEVEGFFQLIQSSRKVFKANNVQTNQHILNQSSLLLKNRFDCLAQTENISLHQELESAKVLTSSESKDSASTLPKNNKNKIVTSGTRNKSVKRRTSLTKNGNRKVLLLSDSHGRHLYDTITSLLPNKDIDISSIFKPNASLFHVAKDVRKWTSSFQEKDTVIILAGTNDDIYDTQKLIETFEQILSWTLHTKVIVAALPYKHNNPGLNNRVSFFNMELQDLVSKSSHAKFLPIHNLPRQFYTRHGAHFNKQGKKRVANMIIDELCHTFPTVTADNISKSYTKRNIIEVVEANMNDVCDRTASFNLQSIESFPPLPLLSHNTVSSSSQHEKDKFQPTSVAIPEQTSEDLTCSNELHPVDLPKSTFMNNSACNVTQVLPLNSLQRPPQPPI